MRTLLSARPEDLPEVAEPEGEGPPEGTIAAAPGPPPGARDPSLPPGLDEDPGRLALEYPDWDAATSYVVSGPLGPVGRSSRRGGRWFATVADANEWLASAFGDRLLHAAQPVPGWRWVARVKRPV